MRLEDFEGAWSVRRRIVHDGAGPRHGSAHGSGAADGDEPSRGPGPSTRRSAERGAGGRPAGGAMPSAPGPERIAGRGPLRGGSAALRRAMRACADRAGAAAPPGPDPARPAGRGDGTPGWEASFEGRATLTPDGEGLVWREEGTLTLPGRPPLAAGRRYLWRPSAGGIAVLFEDGRPFHRIDLGQPRPSDLHRCGADLYRVAYDLRRWPRWSVAWRVDGPRHAYASRSLHAPLAGGGGIGHPRPVASEERHDP